MKTISDNELLTLIRDFLFVCLPRQKNASQHTIRAYKKTLDLFVDYLIRTEKVTILNLSIDMWRRQNICGFLDYIEKERGCGISTRNHRLHCLRAFIRYASEVRPSLCAYRIDTNTVPDKKTETIRPVDYIPSKLTTALLDLPKTTTRKGLRDRMILTILYDSAARVQELLNIRLCDISLSSPATVTLFGKGSKARCVPLSETSAKLIEAYLQIYHPCESNSSKAPLLYTKRSGTTSAMTTDAIRRIVRHYGAEAHKANHEFPERLHPHLLRHTRAMHWYKGGIPLPIVSELLGHANIETTQIYAHADAEMKRKAIATVSEHDRAVMKQATLFKETDELMIKKLCGLG